MTRPRAAVAALSVLLLAGCGARIGGDPVADPDVSVGPAELTAESVIGDFTTMDPCSLTEPGAFTSVGSAQYDVVESMEYCTLELTAGGKDATVWVGLLGVPKDRPQLDAFRVKDLDEGLWISQPDEESTYCAQYLVFPDDITLEVAASSDEETEVCKMVEAGMTKAVEVILADGVEHREPEGDSLMSIDPCDLIDDDVLTELPAFSKVERTRKYPGRHTCFWEPPDASGTSIRLEFGAGFVPEVYQDGGNSNPIAGRPTTTNPWPEFDGGAFCAVETGHIPFDDVSGEDTVELAGVYVHMPAGQVTAGCEAGVAVAEAVWPELPSVS